MDQRNIEHQLLPAGAELGTVVVAHSPTRHGILHQPRSAPDEQVAARLRAALTEIGGTHQATDEQVALAWVHHRQ